MSEKNSNQLKMCPFCGGEAIYEIDEKDEIVDKIPALFCNWCKFTFTVENNSPYMEDEKTYEYLKEKTIRAWNTRKPMERIVERLEEMRKITGVDTIGSYCQSTLTKAIDIVKEGGLND